MALHLYRRHRLNCEGGHAEDSCSSELDERRKGWKRCACGIHFSGTLAGKFGRRTTEKVTWDEARAYVAALEQRAHGKKRPPQRHPLRRRSQLRSRREPVTRNRQRVVSRSQRPASCSSDGRESAGLEPASLRKYRTFTKQITAYAESRGYVIIDQFTNVDIDLFWVNWKLGPRTKGKRLTTLRGFFRFCLHRKWIAESPVSPDIKPPKGASKEANKAPFTDEELARIIRACDRVKVEWTNEPGRGEWTGEDLKDLIWLMVYTGYRISDATFFDSTRLQGNQIFIRAKKNGGDVFTYIPDWLRDRLLARVARFGRRPFITGRSERLETVTNMVDAPERGCPDRGLSRRALDYEMPFSDSPIAH
jgi:hypothetical protein